MLVNLLLVRLQVNNKLLVVKLGGVKSYIQIFDIMRVSAPHPYVVQGSTVINFPSHSAVIFPIGTNNIFKFSAEYNAVTLPSSKLNECILKSLPNFKKKRFIIT